MLSIELSRKLKNAELEWEPKFGDWCYYDDKACVVAKFLGPYVIDAVLLDTGTLIRAHIALFTFSPRLDQLLAEIERRGYFPEVSKEVQLYRCVLRMRDGGTGELREIRDSESYGETWEDAAGKALLYILEQEKEAEQNG